MLNDIVDEYEIFNDKICVVLVDYNGFVIIRVLFSDGYIKFIFKRIVSSLLGFRDWLGIFSDVLSKVWDEVFIF